ncbi:MAG: biotin/lipoyl-containing protein, partial [Planctomycetota bacterium]
MANVIRLPQLGQTMEEGTIIECMVQVGDEVNKGDVIFEIETD